MPTWLDRLPIPPERRPAALLATIAAAFAAIAICCCGANLLFHRALVRYWTRDQLLPADVAAEIKAGRLDIQFVEPPTAEQKLLAGGRDEWLAANETTQHAAVELLVRQSHPGFTEIERGFHVGYICGRIDLIYEQKTVGQLAQMLDQLMAQADAAAKQRRDAR